MNGILFKPWKVKFIAESDTNTELQTRRAIKEINKEPDAWMCVGTDGISFGFEKFAPDPEEYHINLKPRYHVGEVVYIKEAHYAYGHWTQFHEEGKSHWEFFRDTNTVVHFADTGWEHALTKPSTKEGWYKRSPLFLEAEAARYFIKILAVDACRTRDITPEDCLAEGIILLDWTVTAYHWDKNSYKGYDTPQAAYFHLYDSINGKGAHLKNWDFGYLFKRVGSNGGERGDDR